MVGHVARVAKQTVTSAPKASISEHPRVEELHGVFDHYTGGMLEMDNRTLVKVMRDAKILDNPKMRCKLYMNDVDIIFAKVKEGPGARTIDFDRFCKSIDEMVSRMHLKNGDQMVSKILSECKSGPEYHYCKPNKNHGPERFFYDKDTYTGVHTRGGPDERGNGYMGPGAHVDRDAKPAPTKYGGLAELIHRDHVQNDQLNRRAGRI